MFVPLDSLDVVWYTAVLEYDEKTYYYSRDGYNIFITPDKMKIPIWTLNLYRKGPQFKLVTLTLERTGDAPIDDNSRHSW